MGTKQRSIPLWGIPLLLAGLAFSGFVLSMLGAAALASGYWGWGMMWGVGVFLMLGGTFFISRLASPEAALVITGVFWIVIVVGSHVEFFSQTQYNVYRWAQNTDSEAVPPGWAAMDRERVYRAWMADVLDEPDAGGWWDHLRANATAGLSNFERAAEFVEGKSGWREVRRTGWRVWAGWISTAFFAALGCLLAIAGAAVWSVRVQRETQAQQFAEHVVEDLGEAMKARGATPSQVKSVMRHISKPSAIDRPIALADVARLLPTLDPDLTRAIRDDLDLQRQWCAHADDNRALDPERHQRATALIQRFYDGDRSLINHRAAWLLFLIAADRLRAASETDEFWPALKTMHGVSRALGLNQHIPPFRWMNLSGLDFKRIEPPPKWELLAYGEPAFSDSMFYSPNSAWPELASLPTEKIPVEAYPAIVNQYYNMPDPRVYEGWWGIDDPVEVVKRLGPRLRDALLTYIEDHQPPNRRRHRPHMMNLAGMATRWPFEDAAPILERALQSGWRQSAAGVPHTAEWKALLDRYYSSPFGSSLDYVKWYKQLKREEVRKATGKSYVGF